MAAKIFPEARSAHRSQSPRKTAPQTARRSSKAPNVPAPQRTATSNGNGHGSPANKKLVDAENDKKTKKSKKVKLTAALPEAEYAKLLGLKKQFLDGGIHVKKSELIRAGLHLLTGIPIGRVKTAVAKIVDLKAEPKTKK